MDNAEPVFLDSIRENPNDDTARLVYADWLDERGDLRGEWLRLEIELAQCPAGDGRVPKLRERLRALADGVVDAEWLAQVVRTQINVCSQVVRFDYRCSKHWNELAETDQTNVRYCSDCQNVVFLCRTVDEAYFRAEHGRCVALEPGSQEPELESELKQGFGMAAVFGRVPARSLKSYDLPDALWEGFLEDEQTAELWLQLRRVAHRRQRQRRKQSGED